MRLSLMAAICKSCRKLYPKKLSMGRAGLLVALSLAAEMAPVAVLAQTSPGWTTPSVIDTVIPTETASSLSCPVATIRCNVRATHGLILASPIRITRSYHQYF